MPSGNRPILRKTHLLVIGIDDYEHLEKLQNAVGDAMKIAEVFKKRYGVDNITALYNEEATKERVEAALVQLQQSVSANDNLIIYYSGHGEDRALMPVNAQKNLANTHLRHATFKDYLADIKCHHLLLMVDACYAASIVKERGEREEQGVETADERQSRWAVFSSPHDRKASDGIAHQHSPFAQGVLDILQTNTEAQSLFKFYDELCPRVEQAYKQMGIKSAVRPDIGKLLLNDIDSYGQFVFKPKLTENEAWQRALKINTQAEFERFLALFPNSSKQEAAHWHLALLAAYGDEAHTVFDQFLQLFPTGTYAAEARAKRHQLLQNRWDKIKDTGQLDPIEAFVNTFGKEQPFFAEAEECYWALLRQLRLRSSEDPKYYADKLLVFCRLFPHSQDLRTAQQQHEDALWDWARATDTEDAYIAFIAACPTAPFVGDAQKRLQAARSRSSHRETELRYRSALDRYENAILRRNLAQAQQYLQEAKRLWESDFTPDFYEKAYGVFCDSVVSSNRSKALSPQEEKEIYELGKAAIDKIECFDWRTWLENTRQQQAALALQQQKEKEQQEAKRKQQRALEEQEALALQQQKEKEQQEAKRKEQVQQQKEKETLPKSETQKNNRKIIAATSGTVVVLVLLLWWAFSGGGQKTLSTPLTSTPNADSLACAQLRQKTDTTAAQQYLAAYPQGLCAEEAKQVIAAARPNPAPQENKETENEAWAKAKAANTVLEYELFKRLYPNSSYITEADKAIAKLQKNTPQPEPRPKPNPASKNTTLKMVWVDGGSFDMGSNDGDSDERPVRTVTVRSFYMGETEVTQGQYRTVMGSNPSSFNNCGDNCPVESISWYDAVAFCNTLSKKEGRTPVYTINGTNVSCDWNAKGYRLPTEAEWEYAARGGKNKDSYTYAGSDVVGSVAWYSDNSGSKTHAVKGKKSNALGLYDMSGNVLEWCWDWYNRLSYDTKDNNNPRGPNWGNSKVLRGGCWYSGQTGGRVTQRRSHTQSDGNYRYGFRLVLVP